MTPTEGTKVRLVKLIGTSSESMVACLDRVGIVRSVQSRASGTQIEVRFLDWRGGQSFWLKDGEWEAV